MRYICAIRDGTKQPPHAELITNIEADIIEFARAHDVPGTSVYDCPNILREDATRRGYETLKSVVEFSEDIDYRMLEETPEQIRAKLDTSLPIEPTEIKKERRRAASGLAPARAVRRHRPRFPGPSTRAV